MDRGFIHYLFLTRYDRFFASLRQDPRFEQLMDLVRGRWMKVEAP